MRETVEAAGARLLFLPPYSRHFNPIENAFAKLLTLLRKAAVRMRGRFPGDDAAMKLLYLVPNHAAAPWKRPPRVWGEAKSQFAVIFGERFVIL